MTSITVKVPFAANSTHQLTRVTVKAIRAIFQPCYNYLKTGVRATGIIPVGELQYNMFCNYEHSREQQLAEFMDSPNDRYGSGTIRLGTDSFERKRAMRQEYLSKQYTTDWKDIVTVK